MKFRRQQTDEINLNLTPLIDVVFLLLIFFMVSTTFTRETRLAVVLPEATGVAQLAEQTKIEVVVSSTGDYRVNGQQLVNSDEASLRTELLRLSSSGTDIPFVITADANASHQAVVTVMDVAGQIGFANLSITTQQLSEQ